MFHAFKNGKRKLNIEFRLRESELVDYKWVNLTGSIIQDENGDDSQVVACVHDIQQHKMLEEAQRNKQISDSTTTFFRLEHGLNEISVRQKQVREARIICMEIDMFTKLNQKYGLIFGDLLLERLAKILDENAQEVELREDVDGGDADQDLAPMIEGDGVFNNYEESESELGALGYKHGELSEGEDNTIM